MGDDPFPPPHAPYSDAIKNDDTAVDCIERAFPNMECSDDPCRSSSGNDSDDIPIGLSKNEFDRTLLIYIVDQFVL